MLPCNLLCDIWTFPAVYFRRQFWENQSFPSTDDWWDYFKENRSEFSKIKSWGSKKEKEVKVMNQLRVWDSKRSFISLLIEVIPPLSRGIIQILIMPLPGHLPQLHPCRVFLYACAGICSSAGTHLLLKQSWPIKTGCELIFLAVFVPSTLSPIFVPTFVQISRLIAEKLSQSSSLLQNSEKQSLKASGSEYPQLVELNLSHSN